MKTGLSRIIGMAVLIPGVLYILFSFSFLGGILISSGLQQFFLLWFGFLIFFVGVFKTWLGLKILKRELFKLAPLVLLILGALDWWFYQYFLFCIQLYPMVFYFILFYLVPIFFISRPAIFRNNPLDPEK